MSDGSVQSLLQQSLVHYLALQDLMRRLGDALDLEDPELLTGLQGELARRQEQAEVTDALIGPLLTPGNTEALAPLLLERRALLEELQTQNGLLSVKIHGILPVISDELAQLRIGQVAVSGYANDRQVRGERVRGTF